MICQFEFVCIPNGMTAEPKSHGRPTKPQRESGQEIIFRLLGNDRISQSGCRKYDGNCILKSCWPHKEHKITLPPREGPKTALARMIRLWCSPTSKFGSWRVQWNPALRPPRYYDHFFLARQNVHTFSYKNTPLMRPPRLCDQRPPF